MFANNSKKSSIVHFPNFAFLVQQFLSLALKLMSTLEADPCWFKVTEVTNWNEMAAALSAEAPSAVTAVLHFPAGKSTTKLSLALVTVKREVSWDPNRRSPRLIGRSLNHSCRRLRVI